jgi:pyruvate,water dikinase
MFVKRFAEIDKNMFQDCGGKASHLGELTSIGINVPPGFCVVGGGFYLHVQTNNLEPRIRSIAATINWDDIQDLETKTGQIRRLIESAPMPSEIEEEIVGSYEKIVSQDPEPFVAVRSSVAVRNSQISSFPGMMDTYHYIRGSKNVAEKVKQCWASVWSGRGAFARHEKGIDDWKAVIAPIIQIMVNSESAGVAFTLNPITGSKDEIVIESNWGLGEGVVSGKCLCDFYLVTKEPFTVKQQRIAPKEQMYVQSSGGGAEWAKVEPDKVNTPTLAEEQIEELYKMALAIERHYSYAQDIEWAYEKRRLYILQTRRARTGNE